MNLLTHRPDGLQFAGLPSSPVVQQAQINASHHSKFEDLPHRGLNVLIQVVEDRRKTYAATKSQADMKAWITASDRLFSADTRKLITSGQL